MTAEQNGTSYLPPEENELSGLQKFCRIMAWYHLAMIPVTMFLGNWLVRMADRLGKWMFDMPITTVEVNNFWQAPVIGLLAVLAFSCWRVWRNPAVIEWLSPVAWVHGIMALSFFGYYFVDVGTFSYLAAALLEAGLFIATGVFWWLNRSEVS